MDPRNRLKLSPIFQNGGRRSFFVCSLSLVKRLLIVLFVVHAPGLDMSAADEVPVRVQVIEGGESEVLAVDCRRMLVGPDVNQPDPYPGYGGFVGWESPLRLRDGTLLVAFSAGYWHASPPTPLQMPTDKLARWKEIGMPTDIDAPTRGRAMIIRSEDDGGSWSKPETMIDTPWDDRHPNFVELPDGTILCSFFTSPGQGDVFGGPPRRHDPLYGRRPDLGAAAEPTPFALRLLGDQRSADRAG
jgi:hypothetical protein